MNAKVILVAGASSGLGLATARALFEKGHVVYAGARSYGNDAGEQRGANGGALRTVHLDVTDEGSAAALVSEIMGREGRIDALVNCAAVVLYGAVEDLGMDEYQNVMDTNFTGTVRMCKHVLPHMRERRKGLIVNFSSGAGLAGIPFFSAYCSSKHAVEGFSEALRWEVKNWGVDVVIVEPGDNNAGAGKYRLDSRKSGKGSPYADDFKTVKEKLASDEANGSGPDVVADTVVRIVGSRKTRIRYRVFKYLGERMLPLKMILPNWFVETAFFGYYHLKMRNTDDAHKVKK